MNGNSRSAGAKVDHFIKLIVIGDTSVGKTSLLLRYAENTFQNQHIATIGKLSHLSSEIELVTNE